MNLYYETELYHYGIPGMKWGKRKAQARADYKSARRKALGDYYDKVDPLEKDFDWTKKDGGLSNKAKAGIAKADKEYKTAINKAKSDYKTAKANIKAEKKAYEKEQLIAHPYKEIGKQAKKQILAGSIVSITGTVAGALLVRKGHDYAGTLLKEGSKGVMYGTVTGTAVGTAASIGIVKVKKMMAKSRIKKNA